MTKLELEAIRERAEKATDAPWRIGRQSPNGLNNIGTTGGLLTAQTTDEADAQFIAHAREDIPALLAHIDEQAAEIERMKAQIEEIELQRRADETFGDYNGGDSE